MGTKYHILRHAKAFIYCHIGIVVNILNYDVSYIVYGHIEVCIELTE
jgi:hypothetical protein